MARYDPNVANDGEDGKRVLVSILQGREAVVSSADQSQRSSDSGELEK